ncbi:MAG: GTP-binding protein [Promethearchaeota archaeon]
MQILNSNILDQLLFNFLENTRDLLSVMLFDFDGLVIARESIAGFDEELIGAITTILDETINRIKMLTDTSNASGTFDTDDFRLFYLEISGKYPLMFVLVGDQYTSFNEYIPYSYIVAEKVSQVFNGWKVSSWIPNFDKQGKFIINKGKAKNLGNKTNIIVVIGPDKVGKSTLVEMYVNGHFRKEYKPTLGLSVYKKELKITKDLHITHIILDMSGMKNFARIRKEFYKNIQTAIMVFDSSNLDSIAEINNWFNEIEYFANNHDINYILVANKIDLVENRSIIKKSVEEIILKFSKYFEISSYTGEGLDELFMYLTNF